MVHRQQRRPGPDGVPDKALSVGEVDALRPGELGLVLLVAVRPARAVEDAGHALGVDGDRVGPEQARERLAVGGVAADHRKDVLVEGQGEEHVRDDRDDIGGHAADGDVGDAGVEEGAVVVVGRGKSREVVGKNVSFFFLL